MKTSSDYLKEASAVVEKIDVEQGIERHKSGNAVFVDVRDSADIATTGTIAGALKSRVVLLSLQRTTQLHFTTKLFQKIKRLFLFVVLVVWRRLLEKP